MCTRIQSNINTAIFTAVILAYVKHMIGMVARLLLNSNNAMVTSFVYIVFKLALFRVLNPSAAKHIRI